MGCLEDRTPGHSQSQMAVNISCSLFSQEHQDTCAKIQTITQVMYSVSQLVAQRVHDALNWGFVKWGAYTHSNMADTRTEAMCKQVACVNMAKSLRRRWFLSIRVQVQHWARCTARARDQRIAVQAQVLAVGSHYRFLLLCLLRRC